MRPGLAALELIWEHKDVRNCQRCPLSEHRKHVVFGEGLTETPDLAFVAFQPEPEMEHPFDRDESGDFYDRILAKLGYNRFNVYTAYAVSCAPKRGRRVTPLHVEKCQPVILSQLRAVRPKVAIALGKAAGAALTGLQDPAIGRFWSLSNGLARTDVHVPVIITHAIEDMRTNTAMKRHPDYPLRVKRQEYAWEHLQLAMRKLEDIKNRSAR